ncbi:ATP/GTP-binding protein [Streptomyces californicus]|uniref:ATP/GTP-binding protein n=1 Tax=Streptomyces californicus TaxID=67351 RepID=UPI0033DD7630
MREAEIARKAELLKGRTAADVAMMEQNAKLRQAVLKAQADKAGARGKADAASMKPAGGGGKGGTNGSGRGGSGPGGVRNQTPPAKPQQRKPTPDERRRQKTPEKPPSSPPKKGPDPKKAPDPKRAPEQRKGPDPRKSPDPRKGPELGKGSGPKKGPDPKRAPEQRRSPDPKKQPGPHQGPSARKAPDPRKGPGAGPDSRKGKLPDQKKGPGGAADKPGWGKWKKRPEDGPSNGRGKDQKQPGTDRTAKDQAAKDRAAKDRSGRRDQGKGGRWKRRTSPGKGTDGGSEPRTEPNGPKGPDGSGKARRDSFKGAWGWWKKPESNSAATEGGEPRSAPGGGRRQGAADPFEDLFGQEDPQHTTDRPDRPATGHRSDGAASQTDADDEADVVDAVIVEDPGDPFGADRLRRPGLTTGAPGLPPAPEPHTQRPGTSRSADTTTEGDSVSSAHVSKPSGGGGGLAAQHRTDITFGDFLMEMAATALKASSDQERAEALAEALGKVADALREMAADLVGDHNITTEVTDLIADLADSAGRMKEQARRCAEQCGLAKEAVALVATQVARVYGKDMAAKRDAGLKHTSAAAHHD